VPPPMARAIGLEIKKCLVWKTEQQASAAEQRDADDASVDENQLLDR